MENKTNQVAIFNEDSVKQTMSFLNNLEDQVKGKVYADLEKLALEIIRREQEVEKHNGMLDELNANEIAHNKDVQARYEAVGEKLKAIDTEDQFIVLDSIISSGVKNVRYVESEDAILYKIQSGWRNVINLKGEKKIEEATALINKILDKRAKIEELKAEAKEIAMEQKDLPHSHKVVDLRDLQEISQGFNNDLVKAQLKGDYLRFADAIFSNDLTTAITVAKSIIEAKGK